ncbi:MAG: hypothetical protein M1826_001472 [Phylliscum demangeonii]|nr:MAG: hypothetical protein M1826_001472 [Phylliscum demangeonii]
MASAAHSDEGASSRELVLEASRRNNADLLQQVINDAHRSQPTSAAAADQVADVINEARDGIGNRCLHLAVTNGCYDVLDLLLDQAGVEVDPLDRLEKETPLHKAVRYVSALPRERWTEGNEVVEILLDAGADPRMRNKSKDKPIQLVDPANLELKGMLEKAEFTLVATNEVIRDGDDDDSGGRSGSGSESD